MYDEDDPLLARLRSVALAFPEAVEVESWGRPTFRAGKKIFAVFSDGLIFKPEAGERDALVHGQRFSIPPYFGPAGWLALALDERTDWGEVRELLDGSYRQVALKRMLKALIEDL
jgi:predicted DNA-binding protein (MmcQ/YjbR family)